MFDDSQKIRKRIFSCRREKLKIFCEMISPAKETPCPVLIYAHPFGDSVHAVSHEELAFHGLAVCSLDFCGGSLQSKSDGASTEMSVLTELADLEAVVEELRRDPRVDKSRIYLLGMSQGGFVATLYAARHPEDIAGLMLLCPAFQLQDFRELYRKGRDIPERFWFNTMAVGRKYVQDLERVSIYDEMAKYQGPVLICCGDRDEVVPWDYIRRAAGTFAHARLQRIPNALHDIYRGHEKELLDLVLGFTGAEAPPAEAAPEAAGESFAEPSGQAVPSAYGERGSEECIHCAYIFIAPGMNPSGNSAVLEGPSLTMHIAGVSNYEEAAEAARQLAEAGCRAIELGAGFGNQGAAAVQEAVGLQIPVGVVRYDFNPFFRFMSGDSIF